MKAPQRQANERSQRDQCQPARLLENDADFFQERARRLEARLSLLVDLYCAAINIRCSGSKSDYSRGESGPGDTLNPR